jgi:hypothetical protein
MDVTGLKISIGVGASAAKSGEQSFNQEISLVDRVVVPRSEVTNERYTKTRSYQGLDDESRAR